MAPGLQLFSLQEAVQLDVPAAEEGTRAGPSHDGTGGALSDNLVTVTLRCGARQVLRCRFHSVMFEVQGDKRYRAGVCTRPVPLVFTEQVNRRWLELSVHAAL